MNDQQSPDLMKVEDIMTRKVISADPETSIMEVASIMFKNRFHGVPVVKDKKVIGIVTETDFFTKNSNNLFLPSYIIFLKESSLDDKLSEEKREEISKLMNAQAKDIMTSPCTTILQNMKVKDLLEFFRTTKFTSLPVIDEKDEIAGIVTLSDILGLIQVP